MSKHYLAAALACIACLLTCAAISRADVAPRMRTITTTGDSTIYVVPDKAVISLGIDTFDAKLSATEQTNEAKGKDLVESLKKIGIDARQIAIGNVSISLVYPPTGDRRQTDIEGYRAVRQYNVTVTDIKLAPKVVDTAVANGANMLFGVQYEDSQARKHRDDARAMAAKAAREKAEELAGALDCQLLRPMTITENSVAMSAFYGNNYSNGEVALPSGSSDPDSSLPPGQMAVRSSVSVQFEITDAPPKK